MIYLDDILQGRLKGIIIEGKSAIIALKDGFLFKILNKKYIHITVLFKYERGGKFVISFHGTHEKERKHIHLGKITFPKVRKFNRKLENFLWELRKACRPLLLDMSENCYVMVPPYGNPLITKYAKYRKRRCYMPADVTQLTLYLKPEEFAKSDIGIGFLLREGSYIGFVINEDGKLMYIDFKKFSELLKRLFEELENEGLIAIEAKSAS